MAVRSTLLFLPFLFGSALPQAAVPPDAYFSDEVWAKVGERTCLNCHTTRGDAAESEFILRETELDPSALAANRDAFARMAATKKDGKSKILLLRTGVHKVVFIFALGT